MEVNRAWPMSTRQVKRPVMLGRISPAAVWIEKVSSIGPAAAAQVEDRLARAVARQLGLRAVGVEDAQVGHVHGVLGPGELEDAVGEHAEMALAQAPHTRRRELERQLVVLDDQIVVAEGLPLLESHQAPESRISSATATGARPVTSITRTPASLRIQVSWRRA